MPALCSAEAALISPMMSVTRFTALTICSMVSPARATSCEPRSTRSAESPISDLISLAAVAERCARLRTSPATTAKPRPCSPARAASTAAFSARMLVWKAMPSITPMMSTTLPEAALISPMVPTTWCTISPPRTAMSEAPSASRDACRALSALWRTVLVSSSMLAAVSSSEAACSSLRRDRSTLPAAIWRAAPAIESAELRICPMAPVRRACICCML
ncbi:hypothetical protein D3C87_1274610 [compost metagenome]